MRYRKAAISILAASVFFFIGSVIVFGSSKPYPSAMEPDANSRSQESNTIPTDETSSRTQSIPEGAVPVSAEEMASERMVRDPLAFRDPLTYTDDDLREIASKSVANELTMAELSAIKKGMTDLQIEKVQEYIRLYRDTDPSSFHEHLNSDLEG